MYSAVLYSAIFVAAAVVTIFAFDTPTTNSYFAVVVIFVVFVVVIFVALLFCC